MIDENKIQNYLNGNSLDSYYTFGAHFTNEYGQYLQKTFLNYPFTNIELLLKTMKSLIK